MKIQYPALIEPQESSGYLVTFPDIEEAFTEGQTIDEALFNAAEVLSAILEYKIENNETIKDPSALEGENIYFVAPEVAIQSTLLVNKARGEKSMAELARALNTSWPSVQRLENPKHSPTLKLLDKAAAALGKKLVLNFE